MDVRRLHELYMSCEGRMHRRAYWWAAGLLVAAQLVMLLGLSRIAGVSFEDYTHGARKAALVNLVTVAFFFWPSLAISIKRLHDRDLPGWWAGLLHVLLFLFYADMAFAKPIIMSRSALLYSMWPGMLLIGLGTWLAIEMIWLKGTPGPNRFGPDPAAAPDASASVTFLDTKRTIAR
jgi:uncharacterized membrane protein YhaH (DUF805 family)